MEQEIQTKKNENKRIVIIIIINNWQYNFWRKTRSKKSKTDEDYTAIMNQL